MVRRRRHNVFVSYYHDQNQRDKERFVRMMGDNIIDRSVNPRRHTRFESTNRRDSSADSRRVHCSGVSYSCVDRRLHLAAKIR